jgi:hypothetical protein
MTVFNRSNDIVWGAYGANAVHFSFLLEFMSRLTNYPVGTYTQISVNWHAYEETYHLLKEVPHAEALLWDPNFKIQDPYASGEAKIIPMPPTASYSKFLTQILVEEEHDFNRDCTAVGDWEYMIYSMLKAHMLWRTKAAPERYDLAIAELSRPGVPQNADWVIAGKQWIQRRKERWQSKMEGR